VDAIHVVGINMKILVVEDDRATRLIVKRVAQSCAETVLEAENGLDALAIIEKEDPDLLITDLHLPLFDGFELVTTVRASTQNQNLPVICVSSINTRSDIERLPALRIDDYLLKPIIPAQLKERIKRVLQKEPNWRTQSEVVTVKSRTVFIVDPDPEFGTFVRPLLAPDYDVLEEASGPTALATFKELAPKPGVVILSDQLPTLGGTPIVEVLNRLCAAGSVTPPVVLLLSATLDPSVAAPTGFTSVIRRSLVAEEFAADTAQWLPKSAPAQRPVRPAAEEQAPEPAPQTSDTGELVPS
jgi:CheY-like chemotaxis protein